MVKYFLGFDLHGLKQGFSYVTKNKLVAYFKQENISYTFSLDDDFEEAIVPSGIDYFTYYSALQKKGVKVNVIAASNINDFMIKHTKKGSVLTLSLDAINYYRKADVLYVDLPSQKTFLSQFAIDVPIVIVPIFANSYPDTMLNSQKDAFLHYYRLNPDREIIASYGLLTKKETVMDYRAIARNSPEKDFLFFGKVTQEAMKQTIFEGITQPENLHFFPNLPEELYPSFLQHIDRLLLLGDYLAHPQIMIDCIYKKIPLIAYKLSGYEEIINSANASLANTYSSLYTITNSIADQEKVQSAYEALERLKVFPGLNTK